MSEIADHSRQIAGIYALRIAHNVGIGRFAPQRTAPRLITDNGDRVA